MIKEGLQYIAELVRRGEKPQTITHQGQVFATDELVRIPDAEVEKVTVATLRSLAAYINDNPDKVPEGTFVTVVSPTRVEVVTPVNGEAGQRQTFAVADARLPDLIIGKYTTPESLSIHLRTCFFGSPTRDEVVAFLGGVVAKGEVETQDDGVTQKTTVRQGISMVKDGRVPSVVNLAPFRTFHDVAQPESPFILRLKKGDDGSVGAALFEADGGAWRHQAAELVAAYLRETVPDVQVYA